MLTLATQAIVALRPFWSILWPCLLVLAGYVYGGHEANERHELTSLRLQQASHLREQEVSRDLLTLREIKDGEILAVNERLSAARQRLRERPDRLPEPARAACAGATGRELSGQDATLLVELAADADRLRAALGQCQGWIEAVNRR